MYPKRPIFLASLFWLMVFAGGLAQPGRSVEFIKLRHEPDEFARLEVTDIAQDRFGFMWFATTKGLIRYDGHELKPYREDPRDATAIGSNFLKKIVADDAGDLWIGSSEGFLFHYRQREEFFINIPAASGARLSGAINDLLIDQRRRLWCATGRGLEYVDHGAQERQVFFDSTSLLYAARINCLHEGSLGRIWLGTQGQGLHVLDPETGQTEEYRGDPDTKVHPVILDITATPDGHIWFSTEAPALHALNPTSMELTTFDLKTIEQRGGSAVFRVIAVGPGGSLWLATWDNGLVRFDPESGRFQQYVRNPAEPYSISSSSVGALYFDHRQLLWIGFNGDGVDQLFNIGDKGFEVVPFHENNPAPNFYPNFRCMLEDRHGNIWAGAIGNGLFRYDPKTGTHRRFLHQPGNPQSLANNMIWDLLEDTDGFLWIATHNGLQRLDPETFTFKTYRSETGQDGNAVRSLIQDHQGRIWVGTFAGLHKLDPGAEKIQYAGDFFEHPNFTVIDLLQASDRRLWVATFGSGVFGIDLSTSRVEHFVKKQNDPESLSSNMVLAVREDEQQNLWFATQGGGLCRLSLSDEQPDSSFSFTHWRSYNSDLPDDDVFGLAVGKANELWLATSAGLYLFDIKSQRAIPYTPPGRRRVLRFVEKSDASGLLYAASGKEVYRLRPDSIFRNTTVPPVYLTNMLVNGRPYSVRRTDMRAETGSPILDQSLLFTEHLALSHWQNDLTFEFSALNFVQPEKNAYKFRLEGYDEDWVDTDALNRRIRYTNLAPGNYTFRVLASNNDGVWNETGKSLRLYIAPPWWHTWWAYLAYALLAFLLIRTIYVFQLRRRLALAQAERLKELDMAKTRLYTNVTHEFRTPLTVILGMAQQVKADPKEWFSEGMDAIIRNGKQVLRLVNQMLDLSRLEVGQLPVNFQQGDIIPYLGYLVQSFQSYAATRQVELAFVREVETLQMDFSPDLLARAVNNLLSNAIKFTPEQGQVTVSVGLVDKQLEIRVEDSGVGISGEHLLHIFDRFYQVDNSSIRKGEGTGIGLALVKEIVDKIGGRIAVSSSPGVGTTFEITLPVQREAPLMDLSFQPETLLVESAAPTKLPDEESAADGPSVLIIEDNADVARYTAACLQDRYAVQHAGDGRAGLEKALETVPDIIICDVMMPEMDGYEVCHRLKGDERTSHIPIIMLTAKADADSRLEGLRSGADAYLAKPFNREELELRMENLIALRQKIQLHFASFPEASPTEDPDLYQENAFLQKLKAAVLSRISDEAFGIPELCRELAVSRAQLHRKLKALTGRSASHVVRSIRLQQARELVLSSDRNISEIAYETGFKNPSHFTAVFAEEFGQTPTEIRENYRLKQ